MVIWDGGSGGWVGMGWLGWETKGWIGYTPWVLFWDGMGWNGMRRVEVLACLLFCFFAADVTLFDLPYFTSRLVSRDRVRNMWLV